MPPYNDDKEGGCSEIEVVEDDTGTLRIGPSTPECAYPLTSVRSHFSLVDVIEEDEDVEEEGIEVYSEFSTFLDALMYGCAGCVPCAPESCVNRPRKGILKTTNRSSKGGGVEGVPRSAQPMSQRTVNFSQLEIKEFRMSLGDHPCSSSGPPVMLDWDARPTLERVVSLDEYERMRSPRRSRSKLKLSYRDRKGILEEQQGFTTEEVNRAWAEAIKIRQQRNETLKRGPLLNAWDDVYESWQRKCHRAAEAVGIV